MKVIKKKAISTLKELEQGALFIFLYSDSDLFMVCNDNFVVDLENGKIFNAEDWGYRSVKPVDAEIFVK